MNTNRNWLEQATEEALEKTTDLLKRIQERIDSDRSNSMGYNFLLNDCQNTITFLQYYLKYWGEKNRYPEPKKEK